MNKYLLFIIGTFISMNALASTETIGLDTSYIKEAFSLVEPSNPGPGGPGEMPPLPPPCVKANPSEAQKNQIRTAVMAAERAKVGIEADLKLSFLDFADLVRKADATSAEATAGSEKIGQNLGKMFSAESALTVKILFEIFQPDQREDAFMCMQMMRGPRGPGGPGHHPMPPR